MNTSKHTPGPWDCDTCGQPIIINDATGAIVALVYDETLKPDKARHCEEEDAASNARLISAAPDLLAAAQAFVARVESGEIRSKTAYGLFKAAIEKATGGAL